MVDPNGRRLAFGARTPKDLPASARLVEEPAEGEHAGQRA